MSLKYKEGVTRRGELPRDMWPPWYRWDETIVEFTSDVYCTWPLDKNSVVFELGVYSGLWVSIIHEKYNPCIYAFQPASNAYRAMKEKLHPEIRLYPFGLGSHTREAQLGDADRDGASFIVDTPRIEMAKIVDIAEFIESNNITRIDLMNMNIEGGEYELLPYLIDTGLINIIHHMIIQWHPFDFPRQWELQMEISDRLAETHSMLFNHSAYEAWKINKNV